MAAMTAHGLTDSERFWMKVGIRGENDCWLWRAAKGRDGTGRFTISGETPEYWRAHRFAYHDKIARVPPDVMVIHTCGVDLCCNPKHLKLGDAVTRMAEVRKRGNLAAGQRSGMTRAAIEARGEQVPVGVSHPRSKLTAEQVREIRKCEMTADDLASRHGVSVAVIRRVWRRDTYVDQP